MTDNSHLITDTNATEEADAIQWEPPRTTGELISRYPGLVESFVLRVLLKLQHNRLHASDQHLDISQQMYVILDKPSGKQKKSLLQQFDLSRVPRTPENAWKTWLLNHVITKRTINILKEERRKGRFNQPIHEDTETDEPSSTIPVDHDSTPLEAAMESDEMDQGTIRLNEFCTMVKYLDNLKMEEKETLIAAAKLHATGATPKMIEDFVGAGYVKHVTVLLQHLWMYYEVSYAI